MPVERYDLVGDASGLIASAKDAAKVLNGEFARAQATANRRLTEFTGAAKTAGAAASGGGDSLAGKLDGLKRAAQAAGFGEISEKAANFGRALGALATPMGAVVAGVGLLGAGIGGAAALALSGTRDVDALTKSLADLGLATGLTDEQIEGIRQGNDSFKALGAETSRLKLILADELSGAIVTTTRALATLVEGAGTAIRTWSSLRKEWDYSREALALGTLGMSEAVMWLGRMALGSGEAASATEEQVTASRKLQAELKLETEWAKLRHEQFMRGMEAEQKADAAREAGARKAAQQAEEKARADEKKLADDERAARLRNEWIDEQIDGSWAAEDAEQEIDRQDQIRTGEEIQRARDVAEANEEAYRDIAQAAGWAARQTRQAWAQAFGSVVDGAEQAASAYVDLQGAQLTVTKERIAEQRELLQGLAADERRLNGETIRGNIEALRDEARAQRAAAMRAFILAKGAALTSIAISTAKALTEALFWAGPAAPIAWAGISAAGAAQAALVVAQKPSFHRGGEVDATLRDREFVLTPQAADQLGRGNLAAANRGDPAAAAPSGPIVIEQVWRGEVIDRIVADVLRSGGAASAAVRDLTGGRRPYGGR